MLSTGAQLGRKAPHIVAVKPYGVRFYVVVALVGINGRSYVPYSLDYLKAGLSQTP